ncbi:hypothetical protein SSPO_072010 [Streptomyces antimycoticus]|uniref:IPT/TIG domain-containing protein n=1 Tax=Streptomyces antimycoticus TaxID=68175 RepID=A0A499URB6_9ACTN|nr:hypothetical protein SSPO_072010 [Streptomyces antimycoticus]
MGAVRRSAPAVMRLLRLLFLLSDCFNRLQTGRQSAFRDGSPRARRGHRPYAPRRMTMAILTSLVNRATGTDQGRAGDTVTLSGSGLADVTRATA